MLILDDGHGVLDLVSYMAKNSWENKMIPSRAKLLYKCDGAYVITETRKKNIDPYKENSIKNLDDQGTMLSHYVGLYCLSLHKELPHNT